MALWRREKPYDRVRVLEVADRARARGRTRKAIAGYRRVLAEDPRDWAVHGKIAPLLARAGQDEEALKSFEAAARGHEGAGFPDRGLAVWVQSAAVYPERAATWEEIARLHARRGRRTDAVNALVEGAGPVARMSPERGVVLLGRALEIDFWNVGGRLLLARLLRRLKRASEARPLLEELAPRVRGRELRRVRWALLSLAPGPGAAWRWLRAAFAGR